MHEADSAGRKSSLEVETSANPATAATDILQNEQLTAPANDSDLTIEEMGHFMKQFNQEIMTGSAFSKLSDVASRLFRLVGGDESEAMTIASGKQLEHSATLLLQLSQSLMHSVEM